METRLNSAYQLYKENNPTVGVIKNLTHSWAKIVSPTSEKKIQLPFTNANINTKSKFEIIWPLKTQIR